VFGDRDRVTDGHFADVENLAVNAHQIVAEGA
jgi:hypothetical protein